MRTFPAQILVRARGDLPRCETSSRRESRAGLELSSRRASRAMRSSSLLETGFERGRELAAVVQSRILRAPKDVAARSEGVCHLRLAANEVGEFPLPAAQSWLVCVFKASLNARVVERLRDSALAKFLLGSAQEAHDNAQKVEERTTVPSIVEKETVRSFACAKGLSNPCGARLRMKVRQEEFLVRMRRLRSQETSLGRQKTCRG